LIGCLFVKELQRPALPFAVAALFSSQRRNEIMQSIQRFVNSFCRTFFCRSALQSSAPPPTAAPQPLSLLRLQRGSCCEGANIRPDPRPLQHACHEFVESNLPQPIQTLDRKGKSAR
ncbi:hypothetical protein, partial [Cupriavidus sp.]|uniref:hypothetical protein n=1 Tax=Cupriavidus sp. TaxID=1873897 RepID=UPI0025BB2030